MNETRARILEVSLDVLGRDPDAGMGDIATAAGVVRRTVYGHFPSRADLVRTLAHQAVDEVATVIAEVTAVDRAADEAWAEFVARLLPLARRYRVLVALRRGEYGDEIHALLAPVDRMLADLVERGQRSGAFGRHLPAELLSQLAYSAVFTIADDDAVNGSADTATITSLLILGVPDSRARALAGA